MKRIRDNQVSNDIRNECVSMIQECKDRTLEMLSYTDFYYGYDGEDITTFVDGGEDGDDFSVSIPFETADGSAFEIFFYIYNINKVLNNNAPIEVNVKFFDEYHQNMFDYLSATQGAPWGYVEDHTVEGCLAKVSSAIDDLTIEEYPDDRIGIGDSVRRVRDEYLAPEVDEEFINGEPYGAYSPKYNTFDYKEKVAIKQCKDKGGVWCVYIENIDNKEPVYSTCRATGMQVDELFSDYGIPARVLEIVTNKNGKVYVVGVSDDLTTMPERKVSDSRRVKDATQYSYGGRDWGGHYDEDFENADEEYETAIELMNGYMRLEEEHGIDWKGKETVDTWKNFFYDVIDMGEKANITDPKYIYDELEDANFHSMNWCLCISGILGADFQNEAIDWFSKKFVNKKVGKKTSYDYSTSDVRLQALWQIIQELGLI